MLSTPSCTADSFPWCHETGLLDNLEFCHLWQFLKKSMLPCSSIFCTLDSLWQVEYFDVGTPLSNKYYLGFQHGEMYGLDHNMARFLPEASIHLRPKTDIPGLYLTGESLLTLILNAGVASWPFHILLMTYLSIL